MGTKILILLLFSVSVFSQTDNLNIHKTTISFEDKVALGMVDGTSTVNKFGRAPSGIQITPTDVWDRADAAATQQTWLAPTAARVHAIVSTSADDDGAPEGDGARTIRVYGLPSWSEKQIYEDVVLNGTSSVNTVNSYVIIHRMKVLSSGSTSINVGIITATAATDGTVTAQINIGQGQTQMAIYGIPSGQTAVLNDYYASIHDSRTASQSAFSDINFLINEFPDSQPAIFIVKHTQGVASFGTGYLRHIFSPKSKVSGPAIIKISMTASAADMECSAGFDLEIYDNLRWGIE